MKTLTLLGSTGSIGVSALTVVEQYPDRFRVNGLVAGSNIGLLAQQIKRVRPRLVSVRRTEDIQPLRSTLGNLAQGIEFVSGTDGAAQVAADAMNDQVISAIVGAAGLEPTLAAIEAGIDVALANKEAIVAAGPVILKAVQKHNVRLLPVDSEHSAIYQALHGHDRQELKRIVLTASGGPFREWDHAQLAKVTPEQALNHPTWKMGAKITIDSATLMNKGLEVIEAVRLFDVSPDKVDVVVHPQSIIHSIVEYTDGSMLAQLGATDMRGPLAYAMGYPQRLPEALPSLDLASVAQMTFAQPDTDRFPALRLAFEAAAADGSYPAVLNAANEICVDAFLKRRIGFTDIPVIIEKTVEAHSPLELTSITDVREADGWARRHCQSLLPEGGIDTCQIS